jgi:phenylacetate-CoA ligase
MQEIIKGHLLYSAYNVPFYNKAVSIPRLRQSNSLDQAISEFPIITKKDLLENESEFISMLYHGKKIKISTSGSTGTPLNIYVNRYSLGYNYAFFHAFLNSNGLDEFERSATFAGRLIVPVDKSSGPFHRINWPMRTMLMSSYHISPTSYRAYLNALKKWNPTFIDAYPSAIYELARIFKDKNVDPGLNLKGIVTSSETLKSYQREILEEVFSCPVFDYYGCAEQVALAIQSNRLRDRYLIPSQYSLVELMDEDDSPVRAGKVGKMVCTNVFNKVMPLIRYEIGDEAILSENYPDSNFAKYLVAVNGRVDDVILNDKGFRVGRLDPVFKGISGIKEAQIIQHKLDYIELKIVKNKSSVINENDLTEALKARVGSSMVIDITYCDRIPRNNAGKFRSVISKIK